MGFSSRLGLGRFVLAALVAISLGCSASKETSAKKGDAPPTDKTVAAEEESAAETPAADGPFILGDLIEPFDPPTLEEIEKSVKWSDMPVIDTLKLLREHKAKEP